jgi:hypothetical protein
MSECPVCIGIEGYSIHMCGRGDEMSQCTCATDKQITCIVHPTEPSLKARIAELRAENQRLRDALNAISHDAEDAEIVRMAVNALLGGGDE